MNSILRDFNIRTSNTFIKIIAKIVKDILLLFKKKSIFLYLFDKKEIQQKL